MALFPLLIPVAIFAAGKAIEYLTRDDPVSFPRAKFQQFEVGSSGHGLTILIELEGSGARALDGSIILVRPKQDGRYIQSRHEEYADKDGDIVTGGPIRADGQSVVGRAYIPFVAFPDPDVRVDLEVGAVKDQGNAIGPALFEGVQLEATKFDRRHVLAAMSDAAFAAVQMEGSIEQSHAKAAREALTEAWQLDKYGLEVLRRNLKRAASTPLGSPWFDPGRLATDIGDELTGDDRIKAIRMLYRVAAAQGPIKSQADEFLQHLGRLLSIAEADLLALREVFVVSTHFATLGLRPSATLDEVKRAYRQAVKECHPDVVRHLDSRQRAEAEERFRRITLAYDSLMAPQSK
jgi:uncharacterized tellurite resistance protein B-like protein